MQDRPEQNAGYDAAVRGEGVEAVEPAGELDPVPEGGDDVLLREEAEPQDATDVDDRAERAAGADGGSRTRTSGSRKDTRQR
jgi:hypothetical protein